MMSVVLSNLNVYIVKVLVQGEKSCRASGLQHKIAKVYGCLTSKTKQFILFAINNNIYKNFTSISGADWHGKQGFTNWSANLAHP